jgi:hypothetical protein
MNLKEPALPVMASPLVRTSPQCLQILVSLNSNSTCCLTASFFLGGEAKPTLDHGRETSELLFVFSLPGLDGCAVLSPNEPVLFGPSSTLGSMEEGCAH